MQRLQGFVGARNANLCSSAAAPRTPHAAHASRRRIHATAVAPPPPLPALKQQQLLAAPWPSTSSTSQQQQVLLERIGQAEGKRRLRRPSTSGASDAASSPSSSMSVTWLGTSSGSPTGARNVSCTVVQLPEAVYLVDCGEGTHRQLQEAKVDLAKVEGIFITHLHGDHCFGLPTTLQMIDEAKAAAAAASSTQPALGLSDLDTSDDSRAVPGQQSSIASPTLPAATPVYGPPGLIELLRVSLVLTGKEQQLHTRIAVTELVLGAGNEFDGSMAASDLAASISNQSEGEPWNSNTGDAGPAQWNQTTRPVGNSAGMIDGAGSSNMSWHSLSSQSVFSNPALRAAADAVKRGLQEMPSIWQPSRVAREAEAARRQQQQASRETGVSVQSAPEYNGHNYIASFGQYWELPCKHARVRAAQLQHRVPCWGFVFEELLPASSPGQSVDVLRQDPRLPSQDDSVASAAGGQDAPEGMVIGRKVVILGDTIASAPIAPLALGCDVISHEATFMAGMERTCRMAQHSTAYLAGAFAECVQAKHLVLTHFSGRYGPAITSGPPQRGKARPGAGRGATC